MRHQGKKAQASDPSAVGKSRKSREAWESYQSRVFEFLDATDDKFREYMIWKNETDLWFFELYGQKIEVKSCNFLEWLEWGRLEETEKLNPDEVTEDTIDADFEYA